MMNGNELELRKALSNIIDNAMKYHKENTALKVSCKQCQDRVKVQFSNTSILNHKEPKNLRNDLFA